MSGVLGVALVTIVLLLVFSCVSHLVVHLS